MVIIYHYICIALSMCMHGALQAIDILYDIKQVLTTENMTKGTTDGCRRG